MRKARDDVIFSAKCTADIKPNKETTMPTPNETRQFKALTDQVISRFKALTRRPGRAYDALTGNETYEVPDDEISKRLVQLLEGLKSTMKPSDYSAAEIAVGEIMKLSAQRISEHHTALNEAGSQVTGGAQDGNGYEWARDWCRGKGMSKDDVDEFIEGLQRSDADQPPRFPGAPRVGGSMVPLKAMDSKVAVAMDRLLPRKTRDSVGALRRHLDRIGIV